MITQQVQKATKNKHPFFIVAVAGRVKEMLVSTGTPARVTALLLYPTDE